MTKTLSVIKNPQAMREKMEIAKNALESPGMFDRNWLLKKDWYPVIDQDDLPYLDSEIVHLTKILKQLSINTLFAVNLDGATALPKVISFPCTTEGYFQFMKLCSGFYYLVFDQSLQFSLLCTGNTYHIFASSFRVIQQLYRGDSGKVLEEFKKFTLSEDEPWRSKVLERYEKCKFFFNLVSSK